MNKMFLGNNQRDFMLYKNKLNVVRKEIDKVKRRRGKRQLIVPDVTFHSHNNDNSLMQCMNR